MITRNCRGDRAIDRELAGNAGLIIQQSLVLYPIAYLAPAKRRRQSTSVVGKQIVGTSSANITEVEGILCSDIAPVSNGVTPTTTRTPCRSECQESGRLEETTILQVLSVKVRWPCSSTISTEFLSKDTNQVGQSGSADQVS